MGDDRMVESFIKVSPYIRYPSPGYGAHCMMVTVGDFTLYYSYQTVVAYHTPEEGLVVRQNDWGPTTGKHLKEIDGGRNHERIDGRIFHNRLMAVLRKHLLPPGDEIRRALVDLTREN